MPSGVEYAEGELTKVDVNPQTKYRVDWLVNGRWSSTSYICTAGDDLASALDKIARLPNLGCIRVDYAAEIDE